MKVSFDKLIYHYYELLYELIALRKVSIGMMISFSI